jgi:hypothetical protein
MTPFGIGIRPAAVTAAVVLATAGGLATAPAHAAAPDPTATASAQPSPTPPATTTPTDSTSGTHLTLSPESALPGDTVTVSLSGWRYETCFIHYDKSTDPVGNCEPVNENASVLLQVPKTAEPNTKGTDHRLLNHQVHRQHIQR